jgi:hypothetical protein
VPDRPEAFHLDLEIPDRPTSTAPSQIPSAKLYFDLMEKCQTRIVFQESGPPIHPDFSAVNAAAREEGRDWPADGKTMIRLRRLDNLQQCVTDVLRHGVPGDLIETGAWRGGAAIFMKAILNARGDRERVVWVADSFTGMPAADPEAYPHDRDMAC